MIDEEFFELFDDFGVLRGKVRRFARVVDEIVQFPCARLWPIDACPNRLEVPLANRHESSVFGGVPH